MASAYTVAIGSFTGPFDLLLHLIARHKLDIHDIPLAQITDDYLAVLRQMEVVDLEVTTEFLLVAATLIELKAARLLPGDDDPELEELALEARDLLYARLLDYRTFKEASAWLADRMATQHGFVPRDVSMEERFASLNPEVEIGVTPERLAALAARAFAEQPEGGVDLSHLQPVRMTVREAAELVVGELRRAGGSATFREITAGCRHRIEVVVCFLSVLELYKHECIDVSQQTNLGELTVSWVDDTAWENAELRSMESYEVTDPDGVVDIDEADEAEELSDRG